MLLNIGLVLYFPNYPPSRALAAGVLGSLLLVIIGYFILYLVSYYHEYDYHEYDYYGSYYKISFGIIYCIGFAILGFIVSFVEESFRKAWLTIVNKTGETSSVALGKKPVSFGSSKQALVRLPRYSFDQNTPGIRAVFTMEYDGGVFVRDCLTGTFVQLTNGSCVDLGSASVVVHIAGRKAGKAA
jgi:hypothetical protein